jgi:hypothetical protein
MTPRLVIRSGLLENQEFPLKPGTNHIGRAEANDICIGEASISSSHCQIVVGDDAVTIIDLNSTNGTFVNQAQVQSARLKAGDAVRLGGVECGFAAEAPAPITATPRVTVRLATHQAPPEPPPLAPPLPPPLPVQAGGPAVCKSHPKLPGRHLCPQCQHYFCDLCVTTRHVEGGVARFCRACGVPCLPVEGAGVPGAARPKGFFGRLPGAFIYPFRGSGVLILIVATIIFAALRWLSGGFFGILIQMVIGGYLFSFMQNILHATAVGDEEMPELPSMANFWEDIILPFFRLLGVSLVSFGPAVGLLVYAIANEQPAAGVAMIPAIVLGCLYFPMAFLAVAMLDSIAAVNPLLVVPSILKAPLEYLVTVVLLGVVFGMRAMGETAVALVFAGSMMSDSMTEFILMIVVRSLWAFVALYLLTAAIRVLGLLYVSKREKFGWTGR